jgi:hypothetical protein
METQTKTAVFSAEAVPPSSKVDEQDDLAFAPKPGTMPTLLPPSSLEEDEDGQQAAGGGDAPAASAHGEIDRYARTLARDAVCSYGNTIICQDRLGTRIKNQIERKKRLPPQGDGCDSDGRSAPFSMRLTLPDKEKQQRDRVCDAPSPALP